MSVVFLGVEEHREHRGGAALESVLQSVLRNGPPVIGAVVEQARQLAIRALSDVIYCNSAGCALALVVRPGAARHALHKFGMVLGDCADIDAGHVLNEHKGAAMPRTSVFVIPGEVPTRPMG